MLFTPRKYIFYHRDGLVVVMGHGQGIVIRAAEKSELVTMLKRDIKVVNYQ